MKILFGSILAGLIAGVLGILAVSSGVQASLTVVDPAIQFEQNVNRPGSDYRNFDLPAMDPNLCERACRSDSAHCAAFTYVRPGVQGPRPRCWLKTAMAAPVADRCCVSGVRGGIEPRIDRPGSDILNLAMPAGGPAACRAACASRGNCRAFTYVNAGVQGAQPRCYIKNAIPAAVPRDCCSSGAVR